MSQLSQYLPASKILSAPAITSPANGTTNYSGAITSGAFTPVSSTYRGAHDYTNWQASTDPNFGIISAESTSNNLTSWTPGLSTPNTTFYVRVRHGSDSHLSAWSQTISYTTPNIYVMAPSLTVGGSPSSVTETPTLTGSAFSVSGGSDTHVSTDWEVRKVSDNSLVWSSLANTSSKTSITVPASYLQVSTAYKFRVKYNGQTYGSSSWVEVQATTLAAFFVFDVSSAGQAYGGGYYAGKINIDGTIYALVVAPKTLGGENTSVRYKTTADSDGGIAASTYNGLANSNAINNTAHPAAYWARGLSIGGYNDWYLPARDELEICYRNLKPTTTANNTSYGANSYSVPTTSNYTTSVPAQTSVAIFKTGGSEAYTTAYHWSSTEYTPSPSYAWGQDFSIGYQDYDSKNNSYYARAVRRVAIP